MAFVLEKNLFKNDAINSVISSTIIEYDIKSAFTHALYDITKDLDLFNKLMSMNKKDRNEWIGKAQIKDKTLFKKIEAKMILYLNNFIEKNNISLSNIVETTRDSILLVNKIPSKLTFKIDDNVEVKFVNKDGGFSSLYRVNKNLVLFDSLLNKIRIKGINDEVVQNSPFINKYYKNFLVILESAISVSKKYLYRNVRSFRDAYIKSEDIDIFRSILNDNKFLYKIGEDVIELDDPLNDKDSDKFLIKGVNYNTLVLPMFKYVI